MRAAAWVPCCDCGIETAARQGIGGWARGCPPPYAEVRCAPGVGARHRHTVGVRPLDRLTPGSPHPQTCGCGVGEDYARTFGARPAGANVRGQEKSCLQLLAVAARPPVPRPHVSVAPPNSLSLWVLVVTAGNNNNNNSSYPPYHARALASGCGPVRRLSRALAFGAGSVRPPSKGSGLTPQITDHTGIYTLTPESLKRASKPNFG